MLLAHARIANPLAELDIPYRMDQNHATVIEAMEQMGVGTAVFELIVLGLRRMAHEHVRLPRLQGDGVASPGATPPATYALKPCANFRSSVSEDTSSFLRIFA